MLQASYDFVQLGCMLGLNMIDFSAESQTTSMKSTENVINIMSAR